MDKISLDIEHELYVRMKKDVFERKTTMTKVIRQLLQDKYSEVKDGTPKDDE